MVLGILAQPQPSPAFERLLGMDAKQSQEQVLWQLASLVLKERLSMVHVVCVRVGGVHEDVCAWVCGVPLTVQP